MTLLTVNARVSSWLLRTVVVVCVLPVAGFACASEQPAQLRMSDVLALASLQERGADAALARDVPVVTLRQALIRALHSHSVALGVELDAKVEVGQLRQGEADLLPKFALGGSASRTLPGSVNPAVATANITGGSTWKLPSSTQLEFNVTQSHTAQADGSSTQPLTQVLQIVQPLLRNAGVQQATMVRANAQLNYAIAQYQHIQALDALYVAVVTAYMDALQAQQQLQVAQAALAASERTRDSNQALLTAGRIAQLDMVQFEADIAQAQLNVAQSRNALASALQKLKQWMGHDNGGVGSDAVRLSDDLEMQFVPEPQALQPDAVLLLRADWQVAQLAMDTARLSVAAADNDGLAQLDIVVGAQHSLGVGAGQPEGTDYSAGLRFSIPLDRTSNQVQQLQARTNLQKLELSAGDLRTQILDELQSAEREAAFTRSQYQLALRNVELNQQKLEAEQEKFSVGRTSAFQLSAAQEAFRAAEVARVQAEFSIYRTRLEKLRATGQVSEIRRWLTSTTDRQ